MIMNTNILVLIKKKMIHSDLDVQTLNVMQRGYIIKILTNLYKMKILSILNIFHIPILLKNLLEINI